MPFKSEKQRKWMHANEPEMAKDWEKKKKKEALSASQAKAAHDKFKETGELPPHLKKLVKKIKKFEKEAKVKNIVVPGLEWMSKIKEVFIKEKMNPEQFHRYMQYVFDTQFKSPEDKIAKKRMIKKINVAKIKKVIPIVSTSGLPKWLNIIPFLNG